MIIIMVLLRQSLSNFGGPLLRGLEAWQQIDVHPVVRPRNPGIQQPNHLLKPSEVDDLVAQYQAGETLNELARKFEVDRSTVAAHLRRRGVPIRPKAALTPEQVEQIIRAYEAGQSLRQLGKQYDVADNSIRNYLLRAGVTLRPARRLPRQTE